MICEKCGCDYAKSRAACPECGAPAPGYEKWASEGTWEPATPVPEPDEAPVLASWKTSVGWSVLGVLVGGYAWEFACAFVGMVIALPFLALTFVVQSPVSAYDPVLRFLLISGPCGVLVEAATVMVYTSVFYRSYFTRRPKLRSPKAISFANCMFGSFVLGPLWNSNLTKRIRGISATVYTVLWGVLTVGYLVMLLFFANYVAEQPQVLQGVLSQVYPDLVEAPQDAGKPAYGAPNEKTQSDVPPTSQGDERRPDFPQAATYESVEFGVSFEVPAEWVEEEPIVEEAFATFSPAGNTLVGFDVMTVDVFSNLGSFQQAALDRADVDTLYFTPDYFAPSDLEDADAEWATLGDSDFIRITGDYVALEEGGQVPGYCLLVKVVDGVAYIFTYWNVAEGYEGSDSAALDYYGQFEKAVASAKFATPEWLEE